ncbi:MAG: hypothetical protein WCO42_00445 [bacterium]
MSEDDATGSEDLAALRERMRLMEVRMGRLERGLGASATSAETGTAPDKVSPILPYTELTVAAAFTRVAMLSFVLLGALILRELTQQNVLGAGFGTFLGFLYAGHLIVLSVLPGRLGRLARETSLFQCCGVALSFVIALESALRVHTLARPTGMVLMAGFAALALGVATAHRKASLAATALVGVLLALVALGMESEGLGLQLALLVFFTAIGILLSWRRAWAFLRPVTVSLFLFLLAVGFVLARKEDIDCGPLLVAATVFWGVVALQHLLAFCKWGGGAVWLPLTTVWLALLAWVQTGAAFAFAAAGVSVLAVAVNAVAVGRVPDATAGAVGLGITAVIAGLIGWLVLDPSGILCALVGTAIWAAIRRNQPWWAAGSAAILMVAAAIRGVFFMAQSSATPYPLIAGTILAAILLTHFLRTARPPADSSADLAQPLGPLILGSGIVVLFVVLRESARRLFPDPASFQLAQTGILAVAAGLLTFCGRVGHRRAVLYGGLACMFLAILKVALVDLERLSGIRLLASIVLLGVSSVGVSFILRRRI